MKTRAILLAFAPAALAGMALLGTGTAAQAAQAAPAPAAIIHTSPAPGSNPAARDCSLFDWKVFFSTDPNWGEARWNTNCSIEIRAHLKCQSGSTFKDFDGPWQFGTNWSSENCPSGTPRWYIDCLAAQFRTGPGGTVSTNWVWPTSGSCKVSRHRH